MGPKLTPYEKFLLGFGAVLWIVAVLSFTHAITIF